MAELAVEFWCARIVVRAPWKRSFLSISQADRSTILARVRSETYFVTPSGNICEPIEVYDSQAKATERCLKEAAAHPGQEYLVVMNADPVELAKDLRAASE